MALTGRMMDCKRFAVHDGPGVRTTLFLKGCSLRCAWCHNPEGISPLPQLALYRHKCIGCGACADVCRSSVHVFDGGEHRLRRENCAACGVCAAECPAEALRLFGRTVTVEEAFRMLTADRAFYGSEGGATLSGGEPLLQAEFCAALLAALKDDGVRTAVDTCGNVPRAALESVLPVTDVFLYDVKHIDGEAHRRLTGADNARILDNLRFLSDSGAEIELRMPLVPSCNDDEATLRGIGALVAGLRVTKLKVLPYHDYARSKYAALDMPDTMPRVAPPDDAALERAVTILRDCGANAVSGKE